MKNKIFLASLLFLSLILPLNLLFAQNDTPSSDVCQKGMNLEQCVGNGLNTFTDNKFGPAGAASSTVISEKVGGIISYVLAFVGALFLIMVIVSGIQWMVAGEKGEKDKISKAQVRIRNAVIGLIITLAAYAITYFVILKIVPNLYGG